MRASVRRHPLGLLIVVGALLLPLAGCGGSSTGPIPGPSGPQVLSYPLIDGSGHIDPPDPALAADTNAILLSNLIYSGLVYLDPDLTVSGWAAQGWNISSDGLTYTFHLKSAQRAMKFSDGTPIDANTFAYSINRALSPCTSSTVAYYLFSIKDAQTFNGETCTNGVISGSIKTLIGDSLVAVDANTLTITLAAPAAYFLAALTYPTSFAVSERAVSACECGKNWANRQFTPPLRAEGGTHMAMPARQATSNVSSGPFTVTQDQGSTITLKNNNIVYWWGHAATLSEIDFTVFQNADTAYAAYQSGQFDVGFPTTQLLAQARTQPDFHQSGTLTYFGVNFNWKKPPFDNLDARIALCLAINRDDLAHTIYNGAVIPAWNIVPPGMPGYNAQATGPDGVTATAGDATKAMQHWQAYLATVGGKAPAMSYLYLNGSTSQLNLAQALQAQWHQVLGINVILHGEDFNSYIADQNAGNFLATRFDWAADYPDPQDFLTLLFSTTSQYNSQGASVPQADTLMAQADQNINQAQRITAYNQAEQLLINQVATCPLYHQLQFWQVRLYVYNFVISPLGYPTVETWQDTYLVH